MMKRRRLTLSVAGLLILVAAWVFSNQKPEPSYEGKSASYWLKQLDLNTSPSATSDHPEEAIEAFRKMGPDAIPFLISALKKTDSLFVKLYQHLYRASPTVLSRHLPVPFDAYGWRNTASHALCRIDAKSALPDIFEILKERDAYSRNSALYVIGHYLRPVDVGRVPILINTLADSDAWVRLAAAHCLSEIGIGASNAVPTVTRLLHDSDADVRFAAAQCLSNITSQIENSASKEFQ